MNHLEKLYALLTKADRQIKYGILTDETADPLITLQSGDSFPSGSHIGDVKAVEYPTVIVSVYSTDYLAGFGLSRTLKGEIKSALKDNTKIIHTRDDGSAYDKEKSKYLFKSHFKIIE